MDRLTIAAPITALVYGEGREIDPVMMRVAQSLAEAGLRLGGFVQINTPRSGRRRCDMELEELASGDRFGITQDRGPHARGCHLDVGEMLRGIALGRAALETRPDLFIVNKFGKIEAEGGGFRPLMAEALELGVPLLVAVPWRNIDGWRLFAGELSHEVAARDLDLEASRLLARLGFGVRSEAPSSGGRSTRPAG